MVDEKSKKRALFETFVDKVVAYKDGKIVVNVDVFGTKAKIESIDGVVNGVRMEKLGSARSTKRLGWAVFSCKSPLFSPIKAMALVSGALPRGQDPSMRL